MSNKPSISLKAFDVSIPSALTNEIPHISIYNILNKHLRNKWSSSLIGRVQTQYGLAFKSEKFMNGVLAKDTYRARELTFTDPTENKIYHATFEKINFSIDGALETEIDYLMHEHARYLSKLYPDDFGALVTLTEAERQSYFNEALHMMHSYFDTEQIADESLEGKERELADFYYRYRFLEGITPIRALTGVAYQEECLLNLLKIVGSSKAYFGFSRFSSPENCYVISNQETLSSMDEVLTLDLYRFISEDYLLQEGVLRIHGKARTDSLEDFLENIHKTIAITGKALDTIGKQYTIIHSTDPLELLDDLIFGRGINTSTFGLNDIFLQATREGLIKIDSNLEALKLTDFGRKAIDWNSDQVVYPALSYDTVAKDIVLLDAKELTLKNLGAIEDKILVTTDARLSTLDSSYLIKLGKSNFTRSFLLGLGNVLISNLTQNYILSEDFRTIVNTVKSSNTLCLVVNILQDDKKVVGGLINSKYLNNIELSKIISNYSYESFDPDYSLELLLEKISFKSQLQQLAFDISKEIVIEYSLVDIASEKLLSNGSYFKADLGTNEKDEESTVMVYVMPDNNVEVTFDNCNGNTVTGKIFSTEDSDIFIGTVVLEDGLLRISIQDSGKEFACKLPDIENLNAWDLGVYDTDDQLVGSCVIGTIDGENYVDVDNISNLGDTSQYRKILGNMIDLNYHASHTIYNKNSKISENDASLNTLEIEILYYETLQSALEANAIDYTATTYDNDDTTASYIYSTAYKLTSLSYIIPVSILDTVSIARLLFLEKDPDYFLLKTCKGEIYSEDILKIEEDIVSLVSMYGRINCLFLDNFGNFYSSRVKKAKVKNDYCYVYLESSLGKDIPEDAKEGLLFLDIKTRADVNSLTASDLNKEKQRRKYNFKQTYRYDDNVKFYREVAFEELTRDHLKFDFDNIFSKTVERTYADNSIVSQATLIPSTLAYLENITIIDSDSNLELCQSLIKENKSLYLDSSLKVIVNPALETKILARNKDYGTISYTYTSGLPSTIDFYNFPNYTSYEPLEEFLKELEGPQDKVDLPDLETLVSRRLVVWGNVIWDANNVNKTVRTLRTIWSGYFTNFRITATDDILPSEEFVISQNILNNKGSKHLNICNYNYAENYGAAGANWILPISIDSSEKQSVLINTCDAYSHKFEEDNEASAYTAKGGEILIHSYKMSANRFDPSISKSATSLTNLISDLNSILIDSNLRVLVLPEDCRPKFEYYTDTKTYRFSTIDNVPEYTGYKINTDYDLNLIYGMIHLFDENFSPLGFLDTLTTHTGTRMLLEMFVCNYIENHCKDLTERFAVKEAMRIAFNNLTEQEIDFYTELFAKSDVENAEWLASDKSLKISDILEYNYNFYTSSGTIPCVACLMPDGKLKIYYCILGKDLETKEYFIYKGSFVETVNGDLLNSITGKLSKNFQLPAKLYQQYLSIIFKYQSKLPDKATGLPKDLSIDIGLRVNQDTKDFEITDRDNVEDKKVFLHKNLSEMSTVPEEDDPPMYGLADINTELSLKESVTDIFPDIQISNLVVESDSIFMSGHKYRLLQANEYFKEYYPTTVQLRTEKLEDSTGDIDNCIVSFDRDLGLKAEGYLYLMDIKAPNRRSNYTTSRETQILDRSCKLSNLHIIGYQQTDNNLKLLLQDSNASYTRFVENSLNLIRPKNTDKSSQECVNKAVSIGFHWADPGLEIGYTFYKRKFVFEGTIDSSDTTRITLFDEDLAEVKDEDNFSLLDHVAVGDQVQIVLNQSSAYYQDGSTVEINLLEGEGYVGPYKVIYSEAVTSATASNMYVILSGPGNLVLVTIPLDNNDAGIDISEPKFFGGDYFAFAVKSGEIVYYDPLNKQTMYVANVPEFSRVEFVDLSIRKEIEALTIYAQATASSDAFEKDENGNYRITLKVVAAQEEPLVNQHLDWYTFGTSAGPNDEEGSEASPRSASDVDEEDLRDVNTSGIVTSSPPPAIVSNIPLNGGYLCFDSKDRIYFEEEDSEDSADTNWMSYPDKIEAFEMNEKPGCFPVKEAGKRTEYINVESATDIDLRNFIRVKVKEMFSNYAGVDDTVNESALQVVNENGLDASQIKNLIKEKGSIFQFNINTGSAADMASIALARILSGKAGNIDELWNLDTDPIYVPKLKEIDVPVYFKRGEVPKWQKSYVAEGSTGVSLDAASIKDLQTFAKALLPVKYVTREATGISSYSKNGKSLVLWDQDTATVSILDKTGRLKQRIAVEDLALDHPVLLSQVIESFPGNFTAPKAYSYSNCLYAYSSIVDIINYVKSVERVDPITVNNNQYNIYSIFGLTFGSAGVSLKYDNATAPLYLPTILANVASKNWETIPELVANVDEIKELLSIATNTAKYQSWLENSLYLDYMTAAVSEYEAFKDVNYPLNIPLLYRIFTYVPGYSTQKAYLESVMQLTTFSQDAIITKGLPYFTTETESQQEYVSARLVGMPVVPESTRNFESIVKTSNIEVTNGYAHIYGTIVWPDLNAVKEKIKSILLKNYAGSLKDISADILDQMLDVYATSVTFQLQDKYTTFTGSTNYQANRETSFKISIDLLTGNISKTQIDSEALDNKNILSIATSAGQNIVITNEGKFILDSEDSPIMSPDTEDILKFNSEIVSGTKLLVFEGLKNSKLFTDLDLDSSAVLKLQLEGMLVSNPEVFYSNISFASDKELKIQSDTIVLRDGDIVTATILVRNQTKDNFQYGFGQVENLDMIPAAWSLFEVPSANFADFATYSNKASFANFDNEIGLYTKPDVFDLYPTIEQVDEDKLKDFYKLSATNKPMFLKNTLGRSILRLSNMPDSSSSGKLIADVKPEDYKDIFIGRVETEDEPYTAEELAKVPKQTIAKEWITMKFLSQVASESSVRLNKTILPEARVIGKDYKTITNSYSVQQVLALADDPWRTVLEKPYKSFELDIAKAEDTQFGENYILAEFELTDAKPLVFEETADEKIINANKAQVQTLDLENFEAVEANASLVNLDLKIVNPTETLPRLVPIVKFRSETLKDGNLRIVTDSHEIYIPSKGYGQALLGEYTLPKDCLFEDDIFYDYNKYTVNENGENFILVQADGTVLDDTPLPKMLYKSFAQANQALPQELATRDGIQLDELLIDMSKFNIGYNSFACDELKTLANLDFSGEFLGTSGATNYRIYEIFQSGLRFSCKALYSILPKDPEAIGVINLTTCNIQNLKYTNLMLVNRLGYTRCYNQRLIPANIRYLYKDGTYKISDSTLLKSMTVYSTDEYGNLLYLNNVGEPITEKTVNPEPLLATRAIKNIRLFDISDSKIQSMLQDCFYYTRCGIVPIYNSKSLSITTENQQLRSLLVKTDPNQATQIYNSIQDVTEDNNLAWRSETSFRFVFNNPENLQVNLNYEQATKDPVYNMAYLKDKNGNLVAKIFFEKPVDANSIIIFQKEV